MDRLPLFSVSYEGSQLMATKKTKADSSKSVKIKAKRRGKVAGDDFEEDDSDDSSFPVHSLYNDVLDEINFKLADADSVEDVQPMSTGSLQIDYILGGGIRPSMYTYAGGEQSSKTTHAILLMAAAINNNVPIIAMRDFEGSTGQSLDYVTSILETSKCAYVTKEQIFGKKSPDGRSWTIPPRVRYSASTKGSSFFNWFVKVLLRLPDKKMLNGEWYLVYEPTKENMSLYGQYDIKGLDKKYGKGIYIKAPDGALQGIVICDSWPAMNPDMKDEETGATGLGANARMFSEQLPRVKGYLASKKVALIGVNQLREKPMTMGDPRYEPGGNALRFASDARLWFTQRALSAVPLWPAGVTKHKRLTGFETEKSLVGGQDEYRYIHVFAKKNKLSAQGRDSFIRLWTKDGNGKANGVDPVWDTIFYLHRTGQISGRGRNSIQLHLYPSELKNLYKKGELMDPKPASKAVTWDLLKRWILGDKKTMKTIATSLGYPAMDLRAFCFHQMSTGVAEALFVHFQKGKTTTSDQDDEGSDDDE